MGTQTHITGSVRFITCWCQKNGLNRFFKTVLKRFRRSRSLTSILTDDSVRVETGFSFFFPIMVLKLVFFNTSASKSWLSDFKKKFKAASKLLGPNIKNPIF
ncbi:hypothetical protein HanIR_Chr04g0176411 [Helianthus annuus]|nr:hypothetical protein HanIR_Chr04g0176411 [Helianthus annuus]